MTGQEYGVQRVALEVVVEVDVTVFAASDLAADVADYLVEVLGVCQMAAAGNLEALVVRPMTGEPARKALRSAWGGSLASQGLASDGHPTGLPLERCGDCGEAGERTGHMECQYPGRSGQ